MLLRNFMNWNVLTSGGLVQGRRTGLFLVAAGLALAFAGCKDKSEPAPDAGTSYYPVAVGNFWVYAVADTTWSEATNQGSQVTPSVATASTYQFKETITETFTDAAGKLAYRLVRAKRLLPTDTWRDDSVFVVSASAQSVAVNRNNTRTLELIFPVRDGRSWNFNAYNNNFNDTITAETRQYSRVGQPFSTGGGTTGLPAATYPVTLTTTNTGAAAADNLLRKISYEQVFAQGVGPVFRRRLYLAFFNYTDNTTGNQVFVPGSYSKAASRRETLIDYGPR